MGTRGAYGFRKDNRDKVTYNHFDSYPEELGQKMLDFINNTKNEELREIAGRIILVNSNKKPSNADIDNYLLFSGMKEEDKHLIDTWYDLLRNLQGDLEAYKKYPKLKHMADCHGFLEDSLFCEYAYIINLDTMELEFYRGFNKNRRAKGRYANCEPSDHENKYFGVKLVNCLSLEDIRGNRVGIKGDKMVMRGSQEKKGG